jgi:two-component system KDP operon response regulator KdpE
MSRAAAVQPLVLVVENESNLGQSLVSTLAIHGFRTIHAGTRAGPLTRAITHEPDLVLVDVIGPGTDGVDLTIQLRDWTSAPIIVLLGQAREQESTAVLDAGANDYIVRPFTTGDLLARMRVWLRETARSHPHSLGPEPRAERIRVDRNRRSLFVEGREVHITPLERKLLLTLSRSPGRVMSEEEIMVALWGPGSTTHTQYLRTHVRQLRQKIERDPARPRHLLTEVGGGYRLKLS